MATVTQMFQSVSGDLDKRQVEYLVQDAGDEEKAIAAVFARWLTANDDQQTVLASFYLLFPPSP